MSSSKMLVLDLACPLRPHASQRETISSPNSSMGVISEIVFYSGEVAGNLILLYPNRGVLIVDLILKLVNHSTVLVSHTAIRFVSN